MGLESGLRVWGHATVQYFHLHHAVAIDDADRRCNYEVRTKLTSEIIFGPLLDLLSVPNAFSVRDLLDGTTFSCLVWRRRDPCH